jgi:hypothetical protein
MVPANKNQHKTTSFKMKKLLIFLIIALPLFSLAQTDANKVICAGQQISMSAADSYPTYHWYKDDASGNNPQLLSTTTQTYTETPTVAGYYNYQVVAQTANGCIAPISDVFKVYVLPALSVSITAPVTSVCTTPASSALLTANVPTGFTYTYQWLRNGQPISGATTSTYSVAETAVASVTYSVNVAYTLNGSCASSASKVITVIAGPNKTTIQ